MIKLAWDTRGRLDRQAYKDATAGIGIVTWLGVIGGALFVFNFTRNNIALSNGVVTALMVVLIYLHYRNTQLSIRRLHDRGLSGIVYLPMSLFGIAALVYGSYALVKIMYNGGLLSLLYNIPGLLEPYVGVFFYKGIGLGLALLILAYTLFISWNLGARGQASDNRYGPAA